MLAALLLCLNMTWSAGLALIMLNFMDAALATHNCPYLFRAALLPLVVALTGCGLRGARCGGSDDEDCIINHRRRAPLQLFLLCSHAVEPSSPSLSGQHPCAPLLG